MKKADVFGCDQCNALHQALYDCAADWMEMKGNKRPDDKDRYDVYGYMQESARTSFIAEMVVKLQENGFAIVPMPSGRKESGE